MIRHLTLENFRNHQKYSIELERTTVLIGKNGIGKTNILEAVTLISFGRSFREDDRKNLIMFDADWARVTLSTGVIPSPEGGPLGRDEESQDRVSGETFEIFLQRRPRLLTQIKQRGVNKKMSEIVGQLPSVVFSPETLNIINGEPGDRRRFLDIAISQIDRTYLKNLNAYTKVRRQRNKLLERVSEALAGEAELTYWDEQLSLYGDQITAKRTEAVKQLNAKISDYYQTISGDKKAEIIIDYHAKSEGDLRKKLLEHRHAEIASRSTIFGPHRDELTFKINNRDMAHYASRGETRSAILALKVGELDYIENERKKYPEVYDLEAHPLLLLDDVYSEFDADRRSHLAKLVESYQTLITTTDIDHLSKDLLKSAKVIELK